MPHSQTTLTSAHMDGVGLDKVLVTDNGVVAIVERDGCMAMVSEKGASIRTQCTKPERMGKWFEGVERVAAKLALEPAPERDRARPRHSGRGHLLDEGEDDAIDPKTPSAKLLTASGKVLNAPKPADIAKMNAEVRALADELASAEQIAPGPASANGWQMLHVSGPARIVFAGQPTRGTLEAKVSTNGQYLCEFTTTFGGEAPLRATKSGWIKPTSAMRAIDVVLGPWSAQSTADKPRQAFAAGTKGGAEQRGNVAATAAVFELFGEVQDALGDACLPELEPPTSPTSIGL